MQFNLGMQVIKKRPGKHSSLEIKRYACDKLTSEKWHVINIK
jgi:hypothetical protein